MDPDVQEILDLAELMKEKFIKLEPRQTFSMDQRKKVREAADGMRGLRDRQFAHLRIAFDPEYADEMKRLTLSAKGQKNET